jgi:hypothetical protein
MNFQTGYHVGSGSGTAAPIIGFGGSFAPESGHGDRQASRPFRANKAAAVGSE